MNTQNLPNLPNLPTMLTLTAFALVAAATAPAHAATNIAVSIGINAPGQYGRIDIDNYPQPRLVQTQPVIYAPSPVAVYQRPIYLYVPQTHQANWGRYCGGYRACGQPVYFVQETWVRDEYRREHDHRKDHKKVKRKDREEREQGHGKGRGHGKGKHGD